MSDERWAMRDERLRTMNDEPNSEGVEEIIGVVNDFGGLFGVKSIYRRKKPKMDNYT